MVTLASASYLNNSVMWAVVLVLWCVCECGGQYWDSGGQSLDPPSTVPPRALALTLLHSLEDLPYDTHQVSVRRVPHMATVGKCCPMGQNLSSAVDEGGARLCGPSPLPFQPIFFDFNETGIWEYESNEWETIAGNPCIHGRYLLDPRKYSEDEFYLLRNGSLLAPFHRPPLLQPGEFCMEGFGGTWEALALPLVCFPRPPQPPTQTQSTWDVSIAIMMLCSVPFLLMTSLTHLCLVEVWAITGPRHCKALGVHTGFLALAFLSLGVAKLTVTLLSHNMCVITAYTIQFSFLACFFWLNILCVNIYLNVTRGEVRSDEGRFRRWWGKYWWCWGVAAPVLLTLTTLVLDLAPGLPATLYRPDFGAGACWFHSDGSTWVYFYGPISLLLLGNVYLFCVTFRSLSRQQLSLEPLASLGAHPLPLTDPDIIGSDGTTGRQRWRKYKHMAKMCLVLFLVMGISWVLEVLSWCIGGDSSVWYFSDLFNSLQGIIIFSIFMRPNLLLLLWSKLRKTFPWLPGERRSLGQPV